MIAANKKVGDSDATNCWMPGTGRSFACCVVRLLFKEYCNTLFGCCVPHSDFHIPFVPCSAAERNRNKNEK